MIAVPCSCAAGHGRTNDSQDQLQGHNVRGHANFFVTLCDQGLAKINESHKFVSTYKPAIYLEVVPELVTTFLVFYYYYESCNSVCAILCIAALPCKKNKTTKNKNKKT